MPNLFLYTTPAASAVTLTLDSGQRIVGDPCFVNDRNDAHLLLVPSGTTGGALLEVTCAGKVGFANRGLIVPPDATTGEAHFQLDDVRLPDLPPPPEPPPPRDPYLDPFPVCQAVYAQGDFDLATKEGCGLYTEACCTALNEQQSPLWGHIRKTPAQNQWNGHAIDAIQLLAKAGHTDAGIYDIVWSTESPEAEPAWSFKGPPDPNLWYYGPMPCPPA
jgi:hypothetical protein